MCGRSLTYCVASPARLYAKAHINNQVSYWLGGAGHIQC